MKPTTPPLAFADWELRKLSANASTIDERLSGGYIAIETAASSRKAEHQMSAWCSASTAGDRLLFEQRLETDGFDVNAIAPLLGDVQLAENRTLPAWAETFRWIFDQIAYGEQTQDLSVLAEPKYPLRVQELFLPVVKAARERRDLASTGQIALLSETAQLQLQRSLLRDLCRLFEMTFTEWLNLLETSDRQPASFHQWRECHGADAPGSLTSSNKSLRIGELKDLFCTFPVLARLLATLTEHWMSATAEFIERLHVDYFLIQEQLNNNKSLGLITNIEPRISDPHDGGRTVFKVTFADNLSIAYAPKDLGQAAAWRNLLDWLDGEGAPRSADAPIVIERGGYGWVEWIETEPCASDVGTARFFRRAGALQCLFQLLQGIDFHCDNIVAREEAPVPVDLETLMHPYLLDPQIAGGQHQAVARAADTLRELGAGSGYLPTWMMLPGNRALPVGGLNRSTLAEDATPAMFREPHRSYRNLPMTSVGPIPVTGFADSFVGGFEAMYRFLLQRKFLLANADGPLCKFRGQRVRVVLRPTRLYHTILQTSLKPPHLSDGVSWSRHFHLLDRFSDWRSDATTSARTSQAERGCLGSLDIPIFSTTTLGTDLALPDGTAIENQFEVSSFEQVALRVAGLSLASMAKSSHLIAVSLSLAARDDAPRRTCFFTSEDGDDRLSPQEQELTDDRAIAQAEGIADLLARAAIRADDGVSWIGPVPLPGHWRHQIAVLGPDICSGAGGIALFLSALHACTSRAKDRELAISALEPFRMELLAPSRRARLARVMTLGGGAGVGSLIYALARVGHFLSDNSLIDDADSLLATITDRMILDDRSFGLMYGTSGAILGMLALCGDARAHQSAYSPFGRALDRAIACGRHLLNSLNKRDWPQNQDTYDRTERDAPGFLPRNAAIALALLRLHAASGEPAFYDAGCSLYESELTRLSGGDAEMLAGRGLACLACSRILKDSQASGTLIDAATRLTMAAADPSDQSHTGNLACLDYLLEASQHFQPDLATIARRRLCLPLRQGKSISRIRCAGKNIDHLGFFDGLAGIGYQTLRFRYPGRLPSVLLLE